MGDVTHPTQIGKTPRVLASFKEVSLTYALMRAERQKVERRRDREPTPLPILAAPEEGVIDGVVVYGTSVRIMDDEGEADG